MSNRSSGGSSGLGPYLQVAPLALFTIAFVGVPIATLLVLSFWQTDGIFIYREFTLDNYREMLTSRLTYDLFLTTIKFAAITLFATTIIGFTCSYFLVFHVRRLKWQIALLLLCTIPFWTSNVIRMISWIPFLGREGIFNQAIIATGLTNQPLDFLLFSEFAVILTYIHLYTLFMIVPIFNSMAKINPNLIEAARDAGASGWQILYTVIIPLSKTGIALGSIFIVTLVMADFFVVRVMSGGQSASVVSAMKNQIDNLFYPQAAAMAMMLIAVVALLVSGILRVVDIRAELAR